MTSSGYLIINKPSMLLKMPIQLQQSYLTLISASAPGYPQMLAAMALAPYCNKTLQGCGTLFRQAHVSSLMPRT